MATPVEEIIDLSQYKDHRHELSHLKLDAFRKDDTVWDVTLKSTDGKELHAHKCVLVSRSEYFERMFIGGFRETTQDVIQINDISGDVLKNIIDFMYTGELVTIDSDNVEEMLNAADMFLMEDVRNECLTYYLESVNASNCLTIKEIADSRGLIKLSEESLDYALGHFLFIVKRQSFLDADVTHIMQLLKSDNLGAPEEELVYYAAMSWVKYDETRRQHLLPDLLEHVRLVFTSKKFLIQEVTSDPLIYSSRECMKMVKRVLIHFNYKYGDSVSKIITDAKPRISTNRYSIDEMRQLRHYECSDSPGSTGGGPINLLDHFRDFDSDHNFPQIEWNQYMNESNFLRQFSEIWRGQNDDSDDEENDD